MGLIKRIFQSSEVVEKVTDAVISGGDKLFHTSEEKVDDIHRHLTLVSGFKLLQRLLVMSISYTTLGTFVLLVIMRFVSVFLSIATRKLMLEAITDITNLAIKWQIHWAFIAVVSIYVLGGVGILKKK